MKNMSGTDVPVRSAAKPGSISGKYVLVSDVMLNDTSGMAASAPGVKKHVIKSIYLLAVHAVVVESETWMCRLTNGMMIYVLLVVLLRPRLFLILQVR